MDVRNSNHVAVAPVGTGKRNKKMSWAEFQNLGKTTQVDEPLTTDTVLNRFDPAVRAHRPDPKEFYKDYQGKINAAYPHSQYVKIRDVGHQLLFSQKTVSDSNQGKDLDYRISYLVDALFIEFQKNGALDVVDMGNEKFTSLDNRRLLIAKKINVVDRTFGIWIRVHPSNGSLAPSFQKRFQGAKTWGEAVKLRIGDDKVKVGYFYNPTIMTADKANHYVKASSQTIPLSVEGVDLSELHPEDVADMAKRKKNGQILI
jgi:hypothetical protein